MSLTGGTVPIMRTLDPALVEQMARELARLAAIYRRTESKIDRTKRDAAIASWRRRLGDGSLSELSVSATLRNRSGQADRRDLVRPIQRTIAELQGDGDELPQVTRPGAALTRRPDLVPTEDRRHGDTPGPGAEPDGGTQ